MQQSYPIKVKEVRKETPTCVSIALDIPEELKPAFNYKPGQYINLIKTVNGEELHRSYSLCSSPMDDEWRVAVKLLEGGAFSTYANRDLRAGDILEVMPPNGKFTIPMDPAQSHSYLFVAAGSGITPVISLIRSVLKTEPHSTVSLIYGSRRTEEVIFLEELQAMKNKFMDRLSLYFVLSQESMEEEIFHGRIGAEKLRLFHGKLYDARELDGVFICGPEEMIFECRDEFQLQGLVPEKIHFELFGTKGLPAVKPPTVSVPGAKVQVRLKADGRTMNFEMEAGKDNILDAALRNKARLPYACKGGVCCTCKAKLMQGEVDMLRNYGLEPDEVEAGYILTCQAIPKSSQISVDYDQ
jgi:ring-1,2-phenylacetyl-CoA epoxidase subunit PaaE